MLAYFNKYKSHYAATIKLGIPIVLGQLGIVLVGIVDNVMVGRHGTEDLAAASFVNSVFNIPVLFGLGFSYGLTPLVGQLFGSNQQSKIGGLLKNSILVNLLIGVLLFIIMGILYFNVHKLGQPEDLLPYIRPYFILQLISLPFVMAFNSFKQFSDGITDTKTPMWIMLSANGLNIIGNLLLIYGYWGFPEMGLTGAGISTLISRIYMLLMFVFVFATNNKYKIYLQGYKTAKHNKAIIKLLNKMGIMVGLQMGMETSLFSLTGIMIGWLGKIELAAHQAVVSVSTMGFMVYYGVGAALSIRVSNFYGQKDMVNARKASLAGFHLIMLLAFIVACIFFIGRNYIGQIFTKSEDVIHIVSILMVIMIFYQFGDGLQITFANSLRGISDVTSMAIISFIGYFIIALPVSYVMGFVFNWGIAGVWLGYPIGLTITGIILCARFLYMIKKLSIKN